MADLAPAVPSEPTRMTVESYFGLLEAGVVSPDDRVELLEGVVVAMTPSNPLHAAGVARATEALVLAVGRRAHIRPQLSLVLGRYSVPEPDLAVVAGRAADHDASHPTTALLVIEVSDASLAQDRLTKAAIYAAAGIPEYWIVNLRDGVVEAMRDPDPAQARWRDARTAGREARLELVALPGATVAVADLLPERDAPL
jgi:Uma2 family endonuclease